MIDEQFLKQWLGNFQRTCTRALSRLDFLSMKYSDPRQEIIDGVISAVHHKRMAFQGLLGDLQQLRFYTEVVERQGLGDIAEVQAVVREAQMVFQQLHAAVDARICCYKRLYYSSLVREVMRYGEAYDNPAGRIKHLQQFTDEYGLSHEIINLIEQRDGLEALLHAHQLLHEDLRPHGACVTEVPRVDAIAKPTLKAMWEIEPVPRTTARDFGWYYPPSAWWWRITCPDCQE